MARSKKAEGDYEARAARPRRAFNLRLSEAEIAAVTPALQEGESIPAAARRLLLDRAAQLTPQPAPAPNRRTPPARA
jgi:hypothetical protein